MAAFQE